MKACLVTLAGILAFCCLMMIASQQTMAASDVVAHFRMGEEEVAGGAMVGSTATTLIDSVGSNDMVINGTTIPIVDSPAPTQGGSLYAMDFSGPDYYESSPAGNILGGITTGYLLEAWLNPNSTVTATNNDIILSDGNGGVGYGMFQNNEQYGLFIGGVAFTTIPGATVTPGTWQHLAAVKDPSFNGGDLTMLINGEVVGQMGGSNTATAAAGIGNQGNSGGFPWSGQIDDVYYATVENFAPADLNGFQVTELPFTLTVDRDSRNVTLGNPSGNAVDYDIAGYSVLSDAGAIIDSAWTPVYDTDSTWEEFARSKQEVAEGTLGTKSFPPGTSIDLGSIWLESILEDFRVEVLLADGTVIRSGDPSIQVVYEGNNGEAFAVGDLNFDGVVDARDWPIFRANWQSDLTGLTVAEAYRMSDLDLDGDSDIFDFDAFREAYEAANGAGSFALLVPEPATGCLVLAGLLAVCGAGRRSKLNWAPRMTTTKFVLPCVCLAALLTALPASADNTIVSYFSLGESDPVDGLDDSVGGNQMTLVAGAQSTSAPSPAVGSTASVDFDGVTRYEVGNWITSGDTGTNYLLEAWVNPDGTGENQIIMSDGNGGAGVVAFQNSTGFGVAIGGSGGFWNVGPTVVTPGEWYHLAVVRDPTYNDGRASLLVNGQFEIDWGGLGTIPWVDGAAIGDQQVGGFAFDGQIDDVYYKTVTDFFASEDLSIDVETPVLLQVNTATGLVAIKNNSGGDVAFNSYEIASAGGSLNLTGWNSLQDQNVSGFPTGDGSGNGWEEAGGASSQRLAEAYLLGDSTLGDGLTLSLGTAYDTAVDAQDLQFRIRLASGDVERYAIEYISVVVCDFNGDNMCNIDDLNLMLAVGPIAPGVPVTPGVNDQFDLNGDGVIDLGDRDQWLANAATENGLGSPYKVGDANLDGAVDVTDFNAWNSNKFTATLDWDNGDFNGDGSADVSDFNAWNGNKFTSSDGVSVVPEPGSLALLILAVCGFTLARRRGPSAIGAYRIGLGGVGVLLPLVALCGILCVLLTAFQAEAGKTSDRLYRFGEFTDPFFDEGAQIGITLGSNNTFGTTFDSVGSGGTGNLQDLDVSGDPQYVAPGSGGAVDSTIAAGFDGSGDYLQGDRLGLPATSAADISSGGPEDYSGIANRGFQLWVKPSSSGNGMLQSVLMDTNQHGLQITAGGTWSMRYAGIDYDSGLAAGFDSWQHLMVVRPFGPANGSRLYVDGNFVAGGPGGYNGGDDSPLVVGANTAEDDGAIQPGSKDFFSGVVDEIEMFVMGISTDTSTDYGTFSPLEDNDFIAATMEGVNPGDVNRDSVVDDTDVSIFISHWRAENVLNGVLAGDLAHHDRGDLDFDGRIDFADWAILRFNHPDGPSLHLADLLAGIPEPSAFLLAACAGLVLSRFRRCGQRTVHRR